MVFDPSPADLAKMRRDLFDFRNEYVEYLNRTLAATQAGSMPQYDERRRKVQNLAVRAEQAMHQAGIDLAVAPPFGGMPIRGATAIVFAHEDSRFAVDPDPFPLLPRVREKATFEMLIDAVEAADALLETKMEELERRRRNPLYWADRTLRAVLGFPAYLISLALGFDRRELPPDRARVLWLFSLFADLATLFGFGRLVGWW